MATVLAFLCSGRKNGYTSQMLRALCGGIEQVDGVEVDWVHLHDYQFGPCRSCFSCIRDDEHTCVQDDDFGRRGEGTLFRTLRGANGIAIGDAVHNWGPTATCHLLIERMYPFLWSGELNGMPLASLSCATNQGMHRLARENICKWAFGHGFRYVGGLAVHTARWERALEEAAALGEQLGEAALDDERDGRRPWDGEEEKYLAYRDRPFRALTPYLQNLTNDTLDADRSLIAESLDERTFQREEAVELLEQALPHLREALANHEAGDAEAAIGHLVKAGTFWTHATWKEFLEETVIRAKQPESYRPLG